MTATMTASRPIRQLPVELANQIAAGEVVERPASVVKELLENSLDAGATRIEISISRGGLQEIIVRDNGRGIPKNELPLAISRHATSKIFNLEELENIQSLGFRGEALASIGSVSRFQLLSCSRESDAAWKIDCSHDELMVQAASHPTGTSIIVQDLFYNTPARRKFMRAEKTEFRHIDEVIRSMALSHFNVSFRFSHNERVVYQLTPADTEITRNRRVAKLCGKAFMDNAVLVDFTAHGLRLWGWITGPVFSRSQNDLQHFYVNGRVIRDRLISHAIRQVYQDWLPPGRHAAYLLQLEIAPTAIDVNVHPTKHEVRFREARMVHDFIHRSLREALSGMPHGEAVPTTDSRRPWQAQTYAPTEYSPARIAEVSIKQDLLLGQAKALLHQRFIMAVNERGLVLVDARLSMKKLHFKKISQAFDTTGIQSRPLLIPKSIIVSSEQAHRLEQLQAKLIELGFDISCSGPESVLLRMIPVSAAGADVEQLLHALLDSDMAHQTTGDMLQMIADITAKTQSLPDTVDEMNGLLREVESLNDTSLWRCFDPQELQALMKPQHV